MIQTMARLVYYSGWVQGVGFRAVAVDIAREHAVSGWVRNLRDGRVLLHAEGTPEAVEGFLQAIRAYWGNAITDEHQEPTTAEHHEGFEIVR
jgi:acylphosphatase